MYVELTHRLAGEKLKKWQTLLLSAGLTPEEPPETAILVWQDEDLIATGSRVGNLLKYIAVSPAHQGEDLTATVLTGLRQDAFDCGHSHLFLYTKPGNEWMFTGLFFYPIAKTKDVLLMESVQSGIENFLSALPKENKKSKIGALVINANPFTCGHKYLVETAAAQCDWVYVFVLSEDKSEFSAKDRLEMVKQGVAHLKNVTVLPTGPYLISAATFPTYFLKDREKAGQVQCLLDIAIFCKYFAPKFSITCRYVGTEPLSFMTEQYNMALREHLPKNGIALREIPRLETAGTPVSASAVRALIKEGKPIDHLVPETTYRYLKENNLCK